MQGFNMGRYYAPDNLDNPTTGNPKFNTKTSNAAVKKSHGNLVVRFELPFPIWCTTCTPEAIVGQGVRFNAEKKKIGNYYSTSIWSFSFRHTTCGGTIVIHTDPRNAEYVVFSGARRRDLGTEKVLDGEIDIKVPLRREDGEEEEDVLGKVEKQVADKKAFETQKERMQQLLRENERRWSDPYAVSQMVRKGFRVERRKRQVDEKAGEEVKQRYGLPEDMEMVVVGKEEDAERARYVEFGGHDDRKGEKPTGTDMFESRVVRMKNKGTKVKGKELGDQIRGNTRAVVDPFLREGEVWTRPKGKRKRVIEEQENSELDEEGKHDKKQENISASQKGLLVAYDSDSS